MAARPKDASAGYFLRPGAFKAPADLPASARALWGEIMNSTPEEQWRPADLPMLAMFCRVAALAAEAVAHLEADGQVDGSGRASAWVKVAADHGKTLALLSAKLRLAPSSRTRPEAHSLQQRPATRRPWERDDDDLIAR